MRIFTIVFMISMLMLISCGKIEQNEFTDLIQRNLNAMNSEDLEAAMATIHEDSPLYANTETVTAQLFKTYDLQHTLKGCKVISRTPEEVIVEVMQVSKKISGPQYQNTAGTLRHTLKRSNGVWKIYNSELKDFRRI